LLKNWAVPHNLWFPLLNMHGPLYYKTTCYLFSLPSPKTIQYSIFKSNNKIWEGIILLNIITSYISVLCRHQCDVNNIIFNKYWPQNIPTLFNQKSKFILVFIVYSYDMIYKRIIIIQIVKTPSTNIWIFTSLNFRRCSILKLFRL
jgi:hypothetical protein